MPQNEKARRMLDAAGAMGDWTLRSRFTFCPAVWAAAFRAGVAGRTNKGYKVRLLHAGVPPEQWPSCPYAEHFRWLS